MEVNMEMRAHAYAAHRQRVLGARTMINDVASPIDASTFSGFSKLKSDKDTYLHRNQVNAGLLSDINRIILTRGAINTFRSPSQEKVTLNSSKIPMRIKQLEKVELENIQIGKNLCCIKAEVDTWLKMPLRQDVERMKKKKKKKKEKFQVPYDILEKYSKKLQIPKNPLVIKTLLRPRVYFNLAEKGQRPLGQIVIELYTEAAPMVVLEFVRLCKEGKFESFRFARIFPGLWVEGAVKLGKDTLFSTNIEYDKRVVDHKNIGVLSFSLDLLKQSFEYGFINYCISVKPLNVLNGYRVGFGSVVGGYKLIQCMQDYGTKNGKPSKDVIVTSCGCCKGNF